MDDNYFYLSEFIYKMNSSFLHRHRQFLIDVTSASGLLALDDFCAQIFYEKKKIFRLQTFMYTYFSA